MRKTFIIIKYQHIGIILHSLLAQANQSLKILLLDINHDQFLQGQLVVGFQIQYLIQGDSNRILTVFLYGLIGRIHHPHVGTRARIGQQSLESSPHLGTVYTVLRLLADIILHHPQSGRCVRSLPKEQTVQISLIQGVILNGLCIVHQCQTQSLVVRFLLFHLVEYLLGLVQFAVRHILGGQHNPIGQIIGKFIGQSLQFGISLILFLKLHIHPVLIHRDLQILSFQCLYTVQYIDGLRILLVILIQAHQAHQHIRTLRIQTHHFFQTSLRLAPLAAAQIESGEHFAIPDIIGFKRCGTFQILHSKTVVLHVNGIQAKVIQSLARFRIQIQAILQQSIGRVVIAQNLLLYGFGIIIVILTVIVRRRRCFYSHTLTGSPTGSHQDGQATAQHHLSQIKIYFLHLIIFVLNVRIPLLHALFPPRSPPASNEPAHSVRSPFVQCALHPE